MICKADRIVENLFHNKTRSDFGDVYVLSRRYFHYPRPCPYVLQFEWLKEVEYGNQKFIGVWFQKERSKQDQGSINFC